MLNTIRRAGLAALFGICAYAGVANAAITDPKQILTSFSIQNLTDVAAALGYTSEILTSNGGQRAVGIRTQDGLGLIAAPAVCQSGVCVGLEILAGFGTAQGTPLDAINRFNMDRVFTKSYTADGNIFLSRYEIADFGIPAGNIASNFSNFAAVSRDFQRFLASGGRSAENQAPAGVLVMKGFGGTPSIVPEQRTPFMSFKGAENYINAVARESVLPPVLSKPKKSIGPPAIR